MNEPPESPSFLEPSNGGAAPMGRQFARGAASFSLVAPLIVVAMVWVRHAIYGPTLPRIVALCMGGASILLLTAGFLMGVAALFQFGRHDYRILGKGIAGLAVNGLLLALVAKGIVEGRKEAATVSRVRQDLKSAAQELRDETRKAYDPKKGITNTDFQAIERIQNELNKAAAALPGDNGIAAQVMAEHVARLKADEKDYHECVAQLREAKVLSVSNLTSKVQIAERREVVQNLIASNDKLKLAQLNSKDAIRSNLAAAGVSEGTTEDIIKGFDRKFAPRRDLEMTIRNCDDRMGKSMLSVLDILETNWGAWRFDQDTRKIIFKNSLAVKSFQSAMTEIKQAGQDQVAAQGKLVNLPSE